MRLVQRLWHYQAERFPLPTHGLLVAALAVGAAAGLYSTARFFGSIIGATLGGVVLTASLAASPTPVEGYPPVFWFVAGIGLLGVIAVAGVKESAK